jgi:metal-responsive CopG/Arc/MetJ family transcriptional regulator
MMDEAVDATDTDRSKFIRAAVRAKLALKRVARRTVAK